jgi:hypothetical protein
MGAKDVNDALTGYIDVIEAFPGTQDSIIQPSRLINSMKRKHQCARLDSVCCERLLKNIKRPNDAIRVKYWEIIADNLSKAGWSWGCRCAADGARE